MKLTTFGALLQLHGELEGQALKAYQETAEKEGTIEVRETFLSLARANKKSQTQMERLYYESIYSDMDTGVQEPIAGLEDTDYLTEAQFGFAAAINGIMLREKPATNFFIGRFWAESLIMAETGAQTGAFQIAGSDSVLQLPFFVTACDYTLIGEELYAASAYLSREPLLLGSLKAQDYGKVIVLVILVGFTLLSFFNLNLLSLLRVQ